MGCSWLISLALTDNVFLSLGYYGNIYLLTDHLLDLYCQSSVYRKQAAMVLNETVRGAAGIAVADQSQGLETKVRESPATQEDIKAAAVSIIEEYTSLKNWHLITVSKEMDRDQQDQQVRIFQSWGIIHQAFPHIIYHLLTSSCL